MDEKPKKGRPIAAEQAATAKLPNVRLTLNQLSAYQDAAKLKEQPLSAWVRAHLDKAARCELYK